VLRRLSVIAAALLALASLAACGGGDDEALTEEEFAAEMTEGDSGIDQDTADCIAESVYDELPDDEIDKLTPENLDSNEAPSEAIDDALSTAIGACLSVGPDGGDDETVPAEGEGDASAVPAEICDAFTTWMESADVGELAIVAGWAQEVGQVTVSEAVDFILSEPETETADQQAAFEGAVDAARSELLIGGCTELE
jgi:hypothetical protein